MIKINGNEIIYSYFPNGEMLVYTKLLNALNPNDKIKIEFKYTSNTDILHLLFILRHLKLDVRLKEFDLYIYYMPYSRMDRNQNGNCFTLSHITYLINSSITNMNYNIYVLEPHSDITTFNLSNSSSICVVQPLMNEILTRHKNIDLICYPDKGAKIRFQDNNCKLPIIYCEKVRDFDTCKILDFKLINDKNINLKDKNVLILDDLCSKGTTFYCASKKLKEYGVNDIYLGTCHMEYTIKNSELLQRYKPFDETDACIIKHIYCLNTMLNRFEESELLSDFTNITIFDTEKWINNNSFKECKICEI